MAIHSPCSRLQYECGCSIFALFARGKSGIDSCPAVRFLLVGYHPWTLDIQGLCLVASKLLHLPHADSTLRWKYENTGQNRL
jgi:hypothetical protein